MKRISIYILYVFFRISLSLRYRLKVKGYRELKKDLKQKKGGILFLANHPSLIDPLILMCLFWIRLRLRPVTIDYLFQNPVIHYLLNLVQALPLPNFEASTNSYKTKKTQETLQEVYNTLKHGGNVLIYPSGGLKQTGRESLGGTSGVQKVLQECPDTTVVLFRTSGLWGSMFSRAIEGKTPEMLPTFVKCFKILLKNLIFFTPRRDILVECSLAPKDFPYHGTRREINSYLENWFNIRGEEPMALIPYYFWSNEKPKAFISQKEEAIDLSKVSEEIKKKVIEEIQSMTQESPKEILEKTHLALDLGLDSLDLANLIVFLREGFGIIQVNAIDLTTVGSVIAFAAKKKKSEAAVEQDTDQVNPFLEKNRPPPFFPEGKTLLEAFFQTAQKMKKFLCCEDLTSGPVTYERFLLGMILLSYKIKKLKGKHIGIMLPASVGVNIVVLATLLAKKIPVMINWTLGSRNLKEVEKQTHLDIVLTSWKFLDKLDNVDLGTIDEKLLLIDELKKKITFIDKIRGIYHSKKSAKRLMKTLDVTHQEDDTAVILFTSGTESVPKGVPLSHKNILSNQRAAFVAVGAVAEDIFLGALPPFHSFGFSATGLFPIFSAVPIVFSPSPLDGKALARAIFRWKVTIICLAPSFLKNLLRSGSKEQFDSLRLVVTGAEKIFQELIIKIKEMSPQATHVEGYGITECSPILTISTINSVRKGVGKPLNNIVIKIMDVDSKQFLPPNHEGLILASGPNIFSGYLNPSIASPFIEKEGKKWYITGDLGRLDEAQNLTLSGRLKRFIKIGGEMVSLASIEEVLAKVTFGGEDSDEPLFAVDAEEKPGEKAKIILFTTRSLSLEEVNRNLKNEGMSNLIRINSIKEVPFIPLLGTGKINYRALS